MCVLTLRRRRRWGKRGMLTNASHGIRKASRKPPFPGPRQVWTAVSSGSHDAWTRCPDRATCHTAGGNWLLRGGSGATAGGWIARSFARGAADHLAVMGLLRWGHNRPLSVDQWGSHTGSSASTFSSGGLEKRAGVPCECTGQVPKEGHSARGPGQTPIRSNVLGKLQGRASPA